MAKFLQKRKAKDNCIAVFDIGSASLGGLLFHQIKDKRPEIIASIRQPVDFSQETTARGAWRVMHKAFAEVANKLKKEQSQNPDLALCVFSSPWYVSQTRVIKVKREKPFKVTKSLIQKLIENEAQVFKKSWKGTVWKEENASTFFEQKPMKTVLNGYHIEAPYNKNTPDLELSAYLGLGLNLIEKKIREDILNYTKPHRIYLHSFPFVLFNVLKHITNTKEGLLFADMNGEITDVFVIKNNIIEEVASFPKGENFLARRLASVLNTGLDEARTTLYQYIRGELDSDYAKKLSDILGVAGKEWGDSLKALLAEIAKEKFLPQNFYFCGSASSLKEINSQVLSEDFSKFTIFGKPFAVKFLLPESFKYHFDFKKGFSDNKDIFLLISSLYANEFLEN